MLVRVIACVEMKGTVWVRDRLRSVGWKVEIADARGVKGLSPLRAKPTKTRRHGRRPTGKR